MARGERPGHIEKFLKRANAAVDEAVAEGVRRADAIIDDSVALGRVAASEANRRGAELRRSARAKAERVKAGSEGRIASGVAAARAAATSRPGDLETLAKLGELRKAGIITDREFRAKKKSILSRI